MSRTTKPCPACKEIDRYRPADDICESCRRDLYHTQRRREWSMAQSVERETGIAVMVPPIGRHYWYPGFYAGRGQSASPNSIRDDLRDVMAQLIETLGVPLDVSARSGEFELLTPPGFPGKWDGFERVCKIPVAQVTAIRGLYSAITKALDDAYSIGKREGRDLLTGLASGELTVSDFNRLTMEDK